MIELELKLEEMKKGIVYIVIMILAVLSCEKNEPMDVSSGFRQEEGLISVIPDGDSKIISFVIEDDFVGMDTKSLVNGRVENLISETFFTSDEDIVKTGTSVSVTVDKSLLPGYDSYPFDPDTKGSTYITFENQVTDLNSFHVYAYTPGSTPSSQLRYAWDEEFTKGADGIFRSVSSREWPDTDPEWSFVATNCPSLHLTNMGSNPSTNLSSSSSIQFKFDIGTSPSYNSVPDAMFAFNYNNTRAEWGSRTTLINNGSTGYTLSTYKARNTLSFRHMYGRIGNVTVVNQTGQNVSNVHITFAGALVSNCYGFGYSTSTRYNITAGSWANKADNKAWITSFGPTSAGTVSEGIYFTGPTSLLFNVSWEADEPGNGHQVYNDVPVTVSGLVAGVNYNLTFTLGMGGAVLTAPNYFTIYPAEASPGGNSVLAFGAYPVSGAPTNIGLFYSMNGGTSWYQFSRSSSFSVAGESTKYVVYTTDASSSYGAAAVQVGVPILIRGSMPSTSASMRYFMWLDRESLNSSIPSIQPGHITKSYAYGDMATIDEGNTKDFSNIFNANYPNSVGAVLYSHPNYSDIESNGTSYYYPYNLQFPWPYYKGTAEDNGVDYAFYNMSGCFKGTHITVIPDSGQCLNPTGNYHETHSTNYPTLSGNFNEIFMDCTNLITVGEYSSYLPSYLFKEFWYHINRHSSFSGHQHNDCFTNTVFASVPF